VATAWTGDGAAALLVDRGEAAHYRGELRAWRERFRGRPPQWRRAQPAVSLAPL